MREYLNADTLFNTIAMLRSGTNGLILVVEGSDDRYAIERHVHASVTVLVGQGGKDDLLEAALLVDHREVSKVCVLIDRDYDGEIPPDQPYADCVVASTNHDLVMDLILVDRAVIHRVIDAHTRASTASPRIHAEQVFSEALRVAARVSILRMLSVQHGWNLNMSRFPFGRFDSMRPNPHAVVEVALDRSKPGPKPTPVLRQLRAGLKIDAEQAAALVGDHDCFGALAHLLRCRGYTSVGESSLATSFFATIDCRSVMKTDWYAEITRRAVGVANTPCFVCPCEEAA